LESESISQRRQVQESAQTVAKYGTYAELSDLCHVVFRLHVELASLTQQLGAKTQLVAQLEENVAALNTNSSSSYTDSHTQVGSY
jgi:hypothetical protein